MAEERRALVTGGAGFIGSHLVDALLERGWKVTVLDDLSSGLISNLPAHPSLRFVEGSILNPSNLIEATTGVDTVFHLAACVSVPYSVGRPEASFRINANGTLNLLEAARLSRVRRFIYSSSSARYGDITELPSNETAAPRPQSVYAAGKLAGEELVSVYARSYGLSAVSLIYFNIFGPRQRPDSPYAAVIPIFLSRLLRGEPVLVYGDGEQTRDFTYVSNVVDANLLAADANDIKGEALNIAGGQSISVNSLIATLGKLLSVEPEICSAPPRSGDVRFSGADIGAAKLQLGYEPKVDWRRGLELTIESMRS